MIDFFQDKATFWHFFNGQRDGKLLFRHNPRIGLGWKGGLPIYLDDGLADYSYFLPFQIDAGLSDGEMISIADKLTYITLYSEVYYEGLDITSRFIEEYGSGDGIFYFPPDAPYDYGSVQTVFEVEYFDFNTNTAKTQEIAVQSWLGWRSSAFGYENCFKGNSLISRYLIPKLTKIKKVTWTNFGSADDEQNTTGSLDLNLNCNYVLDTSRPFKIVSTLSVSGGGIFQFVDGFGKTWGVDIAVQYDDLEALTAWGVYLQIDYVTEDITAPPIGKYIKIGSETSRFPFTVRVNTNEGSTDYVVSGKLNNATLVKIGTFSCVIDSFYFVSSPYEDVFRDPTKGMTFVQGV